MSGMGFWDGVAAAERRPVLRPPDAAENRAGKETRRVDIHGCLPAPRTRGAGRGEGGTPSGGGPSPPAEAAAGCTQPMKRPPKVGGEGRSGRRYSGIENRRRRSRPSVRRPPTAVAAERRPVRRGWERRGTVRKESRAPSGPKGGLGGRPQATA